MSDNNKKDEIANGFDLLFDDHAKLSDYIFMKCGIALGLGELQDMARNGMIGANDEPVLWLRRFVLAMKDEVRELEDSLPWKWWRHESADIQNVRVELVDLFHFLISAAQLSGLTGAEFIELYYKKREVNRKRQDHGFHPDDNKDVKLGGSNEEA